MSDYLDTLARKYNTDKRTNDFGETIYHGYTPDYSLLFEKDRELYKNVLEIGVATGASHKMWYEYFPNAIIYGIDNFIQYPKPDIENDRIKLLVGSQNDESFLTSILQDIEFDVIIDDGGHGSWQHQISFRHLFPKVKPSGYYIIEDLATCGMREYREFDDIKSSTTEWLKSLETSEPFSFYITNEENKLFASEIEFIRYSGELAIIKKKGLYDK